MLISILQFLYMSLPLILNNHFWLQNFAYLTICLLHSFRNYIKSSPVLYITKLTPQLLLYLASGTHVICVHHYMVKSFDDMFNWFIIIINMKAEPVFFVYSSSGTLFSSLLHTHSHTHILTHYLAHCHT